ncbi:hypothetical protein [Agrococcus baldri]|uniref:Uncharacterized protein n=1 Tax=Agrococcus baldri TaxID=153730 RepID=A0AA87RL26_9MICO|nr:hypothetical protein [Agrococcus baldri]GEK80127.1 hypothetical protein ABA31_14780 [Agrococcus baldri]
MNTSTISAAPDQSDRARDIITLLLALDIEDQQTTLARVIAASVHDGPGTALEQFAGTGQLDAARALDEIDDLRVPFEQEAWVDALSRHVIFARGARS